MPDFTPTPEQTLIVEAATSTSDNLLISALAGAAKTSTLILIAEALRKTSILCLAFNKRIADEMTARLPGNCEARTLNGLGHRVWGQAIGKRLTVDKGKTYRILSELIAGLDGKEKEEAYESFSDLIRAVDSGKTAGYIPTGYYDGKRNGSLKAKRLMDDSEFFAWLDEEPSALHEDLIRAATLVSLRESYQGIIDFNDQILMPTVFPASFPLFPLVLVDEAQDLSALNHAMLHKLAKKRIIAVGDACQAIYGFRGAHEDSMAMLQQSFSMTELILSVSFRCPRKVVEAARWRAPHMQYPDWAKEGEVRQLEKWDQDTLPDTAVIICRNNAPLFSMAINLLRHGRYPELVGNDIGKALVKTLRKFGDDSMKQADVFTEIDKWRDAKLAKSRNPDRVHDQAACLRVFAEQGKTLGDAIAYAQHIMSVSGPVKLMTGHKSKGLEFNDVFFLDEHLIGDKGQERNLRYVIQTRAKSTLTYVYSEEFIHDAD